jgi:hypothetical protein
MAGKKPLFVSAPRLVLGMRDSDGKFHKLAFAIGLSLNVSVDVAPVRCLGDFSPVSYEPLMYQPVTGTFQIIRLQAKKLKDLRVAAAKALYEKSKIISATNMAASVPDVDNGITQQGMLAAHLDPSKVLASESFDIEIYLNVNGYGHAVQEVTVSNLNETDPTKKAADTSATKLINFMKIIDCRLTSRNINIAQGQLVNEPLNFMGLLAIQGTEALDNKIREGSV